MLTPAAPVQSVNGKTGVVTLTAEDVGATDEKVKIEALGIAEFSGTTFEIPFTDASSTYTGKLKMRKGQLQVTGGSAATLAVGFGLGTVDALSFTGTAENANAAAKLSTARTITLSGGVISMPTAFDGSANIEIPISAIDPDMLSKAVPLAKGGTGATTATAALVNMGLTATAAELNYCTGVTSSIQTQLNTIKNQDIDGGVF